MGGPKPKRLDPKLTAPDPSLRDPSSQFLQGFMQNPSSLQNLLPQTSALQQQTGNQWGSFLNQLLSRNPGQGVLDATTPIFQRNLQQGADTLRQAGPRFASNTERLVGQQGQQAMQDFNLFSQQVMQEGINQQLGGLTGASNFALGEQANQLGFLGPLFQQMFDTSFTAGGMTQLGTVTQAQPWWQQLLNVGSQGAAIAQTFMPGGAARANNQARSATPNTVSGGAPQFSSGGFPQNPRNPFANPWGTF